MEFIVTAVLFGIISFLTAVHFITHNSRTGKLINKIPGPRHFPIIGNSLDIIVPLDALWKSLRRWADDHYSIYKFWICHWPVINIRHPDDVEILLSSQKHIEKSLFYDFLHPWLNEGLLTSTGSKWRMRRKTLTPAFHFNVLQEFIGVFIENSERMVKSLNDEGGEVVKDVLPFLAKYTLNAICETAMGTSLQDKDPVQEKYRLGVKRMGDILYYRAVRPWFKFDWLFALTQKGREQVESLKVLHYFTEKIIKERKEYHDTTKGNYLKIFSSESPVDPSIPAYDVTLKKKRLAMLDLLIASQRERKNITDLGIREEVDTFIFEGHDTTVMGLSFTVLLLAENTEIQAHARAEIDAAFQEANGRLGMSELQNLTYLDRCIKEALRLFPSVPTVSRHLREDMQLKNFLIPRGTIVNLQIFDVHRDPNFWPQPNVYDPDRFLPDRMKDRHPFSYVPFSGGPRNCIGQKFAMLELKAFVAYLLHSFKLEAVLPMAEICMLPDMIIKSANTLDVKFIPIRG